MHHRSAVFSGGQAEALANAIVWLLDGRLSLKKITFNKTCFSKKLNELFLQKLNELSAMVTPEILGLFAALLFQLSLNQDMN